MLLELSNKVEEKERGQSFWKMNDTVLVENENYIREELKQFGNLCPIEDTYEELMCHIRDVCQALAINKSRVISSKMKGSLREEKELREKIQQGKSDQTILNRYNATLSQINEHENNKQRMSFKHCKKLMQSCEIGNARDLKSWSRTKNNTNSITSLNVGDSVTSNQEEIIKIFENHFSKLYKSKKKSSFESLLDQLQEQETDITTENEITLDEVKKAIDKLNADSSPGSDGITSNFYKVFKREMAPILKKVFNNVVNNNRFPDNQQIAILILLPKTENPKTVDEFRPISLLNTDLKILSHILANRLIKKPRRHQHAYLYKPKKRISH